MSWSTSGLTARQVIAQHGERGDLLVRGDVQPLGHPAHDETGHRTAEGRQVACEQLVRRLLLLGAQHRQSGAANECHARAGRQKKRSNFHDTTQDAPDRRKVTIISRISLRKHFPCHVGGSDRVYRWHELPSPNFLLAVLVDRAFYHCLPVADFRASAGNPRRVFGPVQLHANPVDELHRDGHAGWNGTKSPVQFTGELYPATSLSNPASSELQSTIIPYLNRLQGLGVKTDQVLGELPVLYEPYYDSSSGANNPAAYQQTLNFYNRSCPP